MIEILKDLIEKPAKLRRFFIFLLKITLSVIIASRLYNQMFGPFDIITIGDKTFWSDINDFVVSGRILISLLLFLIVHIIILELISFILFVLINQIANHFVSKRDSLTDNGTISFFLKKTKIIKFEETKMNFPVPDKNFNHALDFIETTKKEELNNKVSKIKNVTVFEVFYLHIIFSLVYYSFLNDYQHPLINNFLIIVTLFFICFLIIFDYVINMIELNYEAFSKSLKLINQIQITNDFISKNGLVISYENEALKTSQCNYNLYIDNVLFSIYHSYDGELIINKLAKLKNQDSFRKFLIITNIKPSKHLLSQIDKSFVKIIWFNRKDRFINKLEELFYKEL